jgi:hypothetical protein
MSRIISTAELLPFLRWWVAVHPQHLPFSIRMDPAILRGRTSQLHTPTITCYMSRNIQWYDIDQGEPQQVLLDSHFAAALVAQIQYDVDTQVFNLSTPSRFEWYCPRGLLRVTKLSETQLDECMWGEEGNTANIGFYPTSLSDIGIVVLHFDPPQFSQSTGTFHLE